MFLGFMKIQTGIMGGCVSRSKARHLYKSCKLRRKIVPSNPVDHRHVDEFVPGQTSDAAGDGVAMDGRFPMPRSHACHSYCSFYYVYCVMFFSRCLRGRAMV